MVIGCILWSFGVFYGHLVYFTAIGYVLWPFGNVVVIWYIFLRLGILCQEFFLRFEGVLKNLSTWWQNSIPWTIW
jgi:hypothetical protein